MPICNELCAFHQMTGAWCAHGVEETGIETAPEWRIVKGHKPALRVAPRESTLISACIKAIDTYATYFVPADR